MSRNGKIARLPGQIREEINRRLYDSQDGNKILDWLNSVEEVKAILTEKFDGRPITKGNLCEWRKGGHRDWEAQQFALAESRRVVEEGKELDETGQGALADRLGTWVVGQYIVATRKMREKMQNGDDEGAWKLLRELCHDVVALRRGDHGAEWLRLEQQRLNLQQQKQESSRAKIKEEIRKENPPRQPLSDEEMERKWKEIFGMNPGPHPMCRNRSPFEAWAEEADSPAPPPANGDAEESAPHPSDSSVPSVASVPAPEENPEDREMQRVMELANAGHPHGAYCLGACYRDGHGVPKDLVKAREWLAKAAAGGIGNAKLELNALLRRFDPEARKAFDTPD